MFADTSCRKIFPASNTSLKQKTRESKTNEKHPLAVTLWVAQGMRRKTRPGPLLDSSTSVPQELTALLIVVNIAAFHHHWCWVPA